MNSIICANCNTNDGSAMLVCKTGCGSIIHTKCIKVDPSLTGGFICENCLVKPPSCKDSIALQRIAVLTNIGLEQCIILKEVKNELSVCREELTALKSSSKTLFNFGANSSASSSNLRQAATLAPPTNSLAVSKQRGRSVSPAKRRRENISRD